MAGIGETLRAERRRQGRSLADAAAETRVRESYLAAIEEDDFGLLGGDVYSRGFIRLYAKYLSLNADELVDAYRAEHDAGESVSALPASTYDDILPPRGQSRLTLSPPALAAVAMVGVLVLLFLFFRGGSGASDAEDPNAPGPAPADVAEQPEAAPSGSEASLADVPANPLVNGPAPAPLEGPPLTELQIDVRIISAVRMHVLRGQPPVSNADLQAGDVRRLTGDPAVIFQLSDASAVEVEVNGLPLIDLGGAGQAVQVSCIIGRPGCDVRPV